MIITIDYDFVFFHYSVTAEFTEGQIEFGQQYTTVSKT